MRKNHTRPVANTARPPTPSPCPGPRENDLAALRRNRVAAAYHPCFPDQETPE